MSNQPRVAKVLVLLLVSMTIGAIVLMSLGNNPPSAGAFCLSSYYHLGGVNEAILSRTSQQGGRWSKIEIVYSNSKAGNIKQLASLDGLSQDRLNCHFVICNGLGGFDGQIQTTERWQKQWSLVPEGNWHNQGQTIKICIISNGTDTWPTDFQQRRSQELIEKLCKKFEIDINNIIYPANPRAMQ